MSRALSETLCLHSGEGPRHRGPWPRPGRPPPVSRGAAFIFPEVGRGSSEVRRTCASSFPWRKRKAGQPRAMTQVSCGVAALRSRSRGHGCEQLAFLVRVTSLQSCRAPGPCAWPEVLGGPRGLPGLREPSALCLSLSRSCWHLCKPLNKNQNLWVSLVLRRTWIPKPQAFPSPDTRG